MKYLDMLFIGWWGMFDGKWKMVDDGVDRETVKEHLSEFLVQENIIY